MTIPTSAVLAACALMCAGWSSCSKEVPARAPTLPVGPARRVILITCDTLRADHLGCYGYPRPTSPRIDELARESLVYESAWSAAPLTVPSISGLLAGQPPEQIGAASRANTMHMPAGVQTLAEAVRGAGFATAAFVSSSVLVRLPGELGDVGVAQGFQHFDDEMGSVEKNRPLHERTAADCTDAVLRWMAGRPEDADRFFLWVHYQDPHGPYTPPPGDQRLFERPHADEPELRLGTGVSGAGEIPRYQQLDGLRKPGEYVDRYDAEIHTFDAELGRLLDGLRARGWLDDALLVLTADHGESLGENDYWFCHGETLQKELLRVPLLVRPPRVLRPRLLPEVGGRRESSVVSYLDLWPTALEALGIPPLANGGVSLLSLELPPGRLASQTIGSSRFGRQCLSITDGRWRLLLTDPLPARLFDMAGDPAEEHDLAAARPEQVRAMREAQEKLRALHPAPALQGVTRKLDERARRDLQQLGYTPGEGEDH